MATWLLQVSTSPCPAGSRRLECLGWPDTCPILVRMPRLTLASGAMLLDTKSPAKEARSQLAPERAQWSDASELPGAASAAVRNWIGHVCLPPGAIM